MAEISIERLFRYRRDLHSIPELDSDLPKTFAYVKSVLDGLGCHVFSPCKSALCAFFDLGRPTTAAFRSDMDALPVSENTGLPFASLHTGCMHACGHDGHMAMLLELANQIEGLSSLLPHNVLLIFQPAEETTGGAKYICQSGVFEKYTVTHIFGMHLWPSLAAGQAATRPGDMLAKSSEVNVDIRGKSSHIARAWEGRDALLAASAFVMRAYEMIDKEVPAHENKLLKFGKMESGVVRNAISAHAQLWGSLRSFTPEVFDFMRRRLLEIAGDIAAETGCAISVDINEGYPPVINDAGLYRAVGQYLGEDMPQLLPTPFMIAEDFSYYGLEMPSLFFLLGTGSDEPLHSDRFTFDESILLSGVRLFKRLLQFPMKRDRE